MFNNNKKNNYRMAHHITIPALFTLFSFGSCFWMNGIFNTFSRSSSLILIRLFDSSADHRNGSSDQFSLMSWSVIKRYDSSLDSKCLQFTWFTFNFQNIFDIYVLGDSIAHHRTNILTCLTILFMQLSVIMFAIAIFSCLCCIKRCVNVSVQSVLFGTRCVLWQSTCGITITHQVPNKTFCTRCHK